MFGRPYLRTVHCSFPQVRTTLINVLCLEVLLKPKPEPKKEVEQVNKSLVEGAYRRRDINPSAVY
jgi:hypothetical protein